MKLPQSFFYSFFKNNFFVCFDKTIYSFTENQTENCLKWFGDNFYLQKGPEINRLEENYLQKHKHFFEGSIDDNFNDNKIIKHLDEIIFTLGKVLKLTQSEEKEDSILENIIDKDYVVFYGDLFEVVKKISKNVALNIKGQEYGINKLSPERILGLEKAFKEKVSKELEYNLIIKKNKDLEKIPAHVLKNLKEKSSFYDAKQDLGFEINENGFYIFKSIKPYILYEQINSKHYSFGPAKAGVKLYKKSQGFDWEDPVVINNYTHPALSHKDLPFQKICNGSYNYNILRKKYEESIDLQIKAVLNKAKELLERGYFSTGGAYHQLTSPIFQDKEVKGRLNLRVTNLK